MDLRYTNFHPQLPKSQSPQEDLPHGFISLRVLVSADALSAHVHNTQNRIARSKDDVISTATSYILYELVRIACPDTAN